jgi:predicted Rossmann-fold nucleotide-binding protein
MEAVSLGANKAGGHVIGITTNDLDSFRPQGANQWVIEERKYPTLRERLVALIDVCDAAIALPGGIGTLAEISLTWNQLLVGSIPTKPLILVGKGWHDLIDAFIKAQRDYIPEHDLKWIIYASTVREAVNLLKNKK